MTSQLYPGGKFRFAGAIACAVLAAGITGCGSNSPTITDPPGSPPNITGNWNFTVVTTTSGGGPIAIYLTSNAGSVSGTAVLPPVPQFIADGCVGYGTIGGLLSTMNPSLTGTVDANGNLTLGSTVAQGGPIFTMTGTVSGATMSSGSFTLTGPCGGQGTVTGIEYPQLDGTYSGAVTSQNTEQSFTMAAVLDQSSGPNSSGLLGLTGTLTVTGYSCIAPTAMAINSAFVGNQFEATLNLSPQGLLAFIGTLSPDGKTLAVYYSVSGESGSCNGDSGSGTLTLQ